MTKKNSLNIQGNNTINANGQQIANIEFERAQSVFRSGIPLLSSVTAHHVVTWLLKQVKKQFLNKNKNPRTIVLKGNAYELLGELSGAGTDQETIDNLRRIIPALSGCLFKYQTKKWKCEGNFLNYRYERAFDGSYSVLIIELQSFVCAGLLE